MAAVAGGKVKAVLCCFLTGQDHLDSVDRAKAAKEDVRRFLAAAIESSSFDEFAAQLVRELERCFFSCVSADAPFRSKHIKREKLWRSFHRIRVTKVEKMWQDLFQQNTETLPKISPLVYQSVTQKLYLDILNCHLGAALDSRRNASSSPEPPLSADEENILRYIAGYVPFKLLKWYEKSKAVESVSVVECLSGMAVNGEESDAIAYTSKWIELVNRGGVFEVSDATFTFFKEVELKVYQELLQAFERNTQMGPAQRDIIISTVATDESIQFHWTILSVDIIDEARTMGEYSRFFNCQFLVKKV